MEPWFWSNLCRLLGCEEFAKEQFNEKRFPEMFAFLRAKLREKTRDEWFSQFAGEEVCATPVYDIAEALADRHNNARQMVVELEDAEFGKIRQVGIAPKFSETPGEVRTLPPDPGQHTREILIEAGYSPEAIEQLFNSNKN